MFFSYSQHLDMFILGNYGKLFINNYEQNMSENTVVILVLFLALQQTFCNKEAGSVSKPWTL